MNDDGTSLELMKLLHMAEGEPGGERTRRWAVAFEEWLIERRTRFSSNVGGDSYQAWREFLAFSGKAPWEARVQDVEAYVEHLKDRGLRPGTMAKRLTALSKFYEHCQQKGIDPEGGAGFNPVAGARRPKVTPYDRANYLSRREEAALLEAIRRDPSPTGKRDYALILTLIRTGWRAGRVREMRWGDWERGRQGDSETRREGVALRLAEKGSVDTLPDEGVLEEVGEAIREWLEASGRREGIEPGEYVFAPSKEPLVREAGDRAEDWDGSRPLSRDQVHYLVKLHAERAGLKAEAITCHTLRHTAAMRRVEMGEPPEVVGVLLGWHQGTRRNYMERLKNRPKGRLKARRRAPSDQPLIPSRGPCRTRPRNHLALQHGLTAKYLPELAWLAEQGVRLNWIDWTIVRWRVVLERAVVLAMEADTLKEGIWMLRAAGTAAVRLAKIKKLRRELEEGEQAQWLAEELMPRFEDGERR